MRRLVAVMGVCALAAPALAQSYSFEPPTYAGSAAGTLLTATVFTTPPTFGQDGWYIPAAASADYFVYTYAGNALGIAPNPSAGAADQFIGGTSGPVLNTFARAQHDFSFVGKGSWRASFDVAVKYNGVLPSAPNLGSFSLQPSTTARAWQTLYNWVNVATADSWNCAFLPFNAAGVQAAQPGLLPDPGFGALAPDTWYRLTVIWSFESNRIHTVSLLNKATGALVTASPVDYYLLGGAAPAPAVTLPTAARFFAGGAIGNVVGSDNFRLSNCYADCNNDGSLTVADFGCFQTRFVQGDTAYADCNNDAALTVGDFGCFQTSFVLGCPAP